MLLERSHTGVRPTAAGQRLYEDAVRLLADLDPARTAVVVVSKTFGTQEFDSGHALAHLVVGCVLLGMMLVGIVALFVFGQRQRGLATQHRRFVASVTHELRSPLASLQLSFETLRRREIDHEPAGPRGPQPRFRLLELRFVDHVE
jgi:signal transduction histidine kinase